MAIKTSNNEGYTLFIATILVAILVGFIFLPELNAIVLGVAFSVLFQPLYRWLKKHMPREGSAAALVVVLITVIVIFTPLIFFGFQMFFEAQGLYANIASGSGLPLVAKVQEWIHTVSPSLNLDVNFYLQQGLGFVINNIGGVVSGILTILGTFFLSFFALYYFLRDGERVRDVLMRRSPLSEDRTKEIFTRLYTMMESIIRGSIVVSVLYGLLVGIGFFVFGLPSAALWGAVTIVASFIPVVGVLLVVVPGIIALLLAHSIPQAIGLIVWTMLMSAVMENFMRPRLVGRNSGIHPLLLFFGVLGGVSFFGPIGILLGPMMVGVLLTLLDIPSSSTA